MMEITDRDIERVERLFFPDGGDFKDEKGERYEFIKCIDRSVDVHACPGSGKTTSLLAKLYLLSEKMPFEDGRSICVLTHTNVAIDTIKNRLGPKADNLFKYPNFFGTIQTFVDRYLSIPCFIELTGMRPHYIDSDLQRIRMEKTWLSGKYYQGLNNFKRLHYATGLFGNYTFQKNKDEYFLINSKTSRLINIIKPKSRADWSQSEKKEIISAGVELKKQVLFEQGVLSFDDAYWLAFMYLRKYKNLIEIFSKRFGFVFIDEMQDTYSHQLEILDSIFDESVIIQRVGDLNQAILGNDSGETSWQKSDTVLKITGSKRVSEPIAEILKCVAVAPELELNGLNTSSISRHIITYDKQDIHLVIEKFIELIANHNLVEISKNTNYPFKAIGWVGKEKDGLTIGSYFINYNKAIRSDRVSFPNLKTLLANSLEVNPPDFRDKIFIAILEVLNLDGIRHDVNGTNKRFTKSSLTKYLKSTEPQFYQLLLSNISEWYLTKRSISLDELHQRISKFLITNLFKNYSLPIDRKGTKFLESEDLFDIEIDEAKASNIYHSQNGKLKNIPVEVDTVHGVKGETHTATLYLETKYYKTCGEHLINQLIGEPYDGFEKKGNTNRDMCMKVAHVGFSRPTDLLCVAVNRELVNRYKKGLKDFGWEII